MKITFESSVGVGLLLFVFIRSNNALNSNENCCANGLRYDTKINGCKSSTGTVSNVQLTCSRRYLLDGTVDEEDLFEVDPNGTLLVGNNQDPVEKGKFCTTDVWDSKNNTHPVALVCFDEENPLTARLWIPFKTALIFLSVTFLILTLYIYWTIPDLRQTEDKVTCIAIVCLTTFMILLGVIQLLPYMETKEVCIAIGFGIYFFAMGYFSWLNCIMLNVWKNCVLSRWQIKERNWFLLNNLYGWSVPMLALMIGIIIHLDSPSIGESSCFFNHATEQWIFLYLPMSLMLTLNLVLGIWTAICLYRRGDDISPDRKKRLRFKMKLYVKVFLLAGVTWIFEVLSFTFGESHMPSNVFWLLCDIVNALHGVLLFLVLILWRSRIKRELAGKRICCLKWPKSWTNTTDIEQEQLNSDEGRNMNFKADVK